MKDLAWKFAKLHKPHQGETDIEIIKPDGNKWIVELFESGEQITVSESDFSIVED